MEPAEAEAAFTMVLDSLPHAQACAPSEVEKSRTLQMQQQRPLLHEIRAQVKGNALVWLADAGKRDFASQAAHDVLVRLMREPFYSELRTKQQVRARVCISSVQCTPIIVRQAHDPNLNPPNTDGLCCPLGRFHSGQAHVCSSPHSKQLA
jgi:hypothetical protein